MIDLLARALVCPKCAHPHFTLEEYHAQCAKCFEVIRFKEIRKLITKQEGWDLDAITKLFSKIIR